MNRNDTYQEFERQQAGEAGSKPASPRSTRVIIGYGWLFVMSLGITAFLVVAAVFLIDADYYEGVSAFGSLLAAAAGVTAALIAVGSLQATIKGQQEELTQQTRIFSAEFISGLDERFNNMKPIRATAAKYLLTDAPVDDSEEERIGEQAVVEVLGLFESMAFFARRGVLDKEFVWTHYYLFMLTYWNFARIRWREVIEREPLYWIDLRELIEEFGEYDEFKRRRLGIPSTEPPSQYLLRGYLETEATSR